MVVVAILSVVDIKPRIRWCVAAAELDFPWEIVGERHGSAVIVVEGQGVGHGFASNLSAFKQELEIEHELSSRDEALSDHAVDCSQ